MRSNSSTFKMTFLAKVIIFTRIVSRAGFMPAILKMGKDGVLNPYETATFTMIIFADSILGTYYGLYTALRSIRPLGLDLDRAVDVRYSILQVINDTAKRSRKFSRRAKYGGCATLSLLVLAFMTSALLYINPVPYRNADRSLQNATLILGAFSMFSQIITVFLYAFCFTYHLYAVKFRVWHLTREIEKHGAPRVVKSLKEYAEIMRFSVRNVSKCWGTSVLVLGSLSLFWLVAEVFFTGADLKNLFVVDTMFSDFSALFVYLKILFLLVFPLYLIFVAASLTTSCYHLVRETRIALLRGDIHDPHADAFLPETIGGDVGRVVSRLVVLLASAEDFGFCITKGTKLSISRAGTIVTIIYTLLFYAYTLSEKYKSSLLSCDIPPKL